MKELLKGINSVKQNEKLSRYNNKIFVFRANEFLLNFPTTVLLINNVTDFP